MKFFCARAGGSFCLRTKLLIRIRQTQCKLIPRTIRLFFSIPAWGTCCHKRSATYFTMHCWQLFWITAQRRLGHKWHIFWICTASCWICDSLLQGVQQPVILCLCRSVSHQKNLAAASVGFMIICAVLMISHSLCHLCCTSVAKSVSIAVRRKRNNPKIESVLARLSGQEIDFNL